MKASVLGGSGYVGGELIRLLLDHPEVELVQATSERFKGKPFSRVHPNLRQRTALRFSATEDVEPADIIFSALPHGTLMNGIDRVMDLAPRLIDLSGDHRLNNPSDYQRWYDTDHPRPELLEEFVYGIVELHREEIARSKLVSSAGCNATATILSLHPIIKNGLIDPERSIVAEAKCGSSEGGNSSSPASHHPVRSGCVRSYKPTGHRHTAEIVQELGVEVDLSATALDMVRGILVTANSRMIEPFEERDIWYSYRSEYSDEPFIRFVKERSGSYRYPEPKLLSGTNFCDIGFETDDTRIVIMGAIDNLMKGAAGQAVHAMNVMCGFPEISGLEFGGIHPI